MNQIETGYKPEFALGALYQGQNAANAQSQNDQELLKQFLANQHALENNPIIEAKNRASLVSDQWGAKRDQAKMDDPSFIAQLLAGEKGQQQSSEAAGRLAMAVLKHKIDLANAASPGEIDQAKLQSLLAKFNLGAAQPPEEQPTPDATISEGFSMPNGSTSAGRNAFFPATPATPNVGDPAYLGVAARPMEMPFQPNGKPVQPASSNFAGNLTAGREAQAELLASELAHATPERKKAILREIATMQKTEAGGYRGDPAPVSGEGAAPAPVLSNMIAPTQLASNTDRERAMGVAVDSVEHRQKLALDKQKGDAALARAQAQAEANKHRAEKAENESNYVARLYHTAYTDPKATPEQKQAALTAISARNVDKLSQNPLSYATPADVATLGNIPTKESVLSQARATSGQPAAAPKEGTVEWGKAAPAGTVYNGKTKQSNGPNGTWK